MTGSTLDTEAGIVDLLARMRPRLRSILASFRIPAMEAEDLLQDACLSLIRNWTRIENPEAWLTKALFRLSHAAATARRRAALQNLDSAVLETLALVQKPAQEHAELLLDLATLAVLLSHRQRLLLQLHYGFGMSWEEIAVRLGSPSCSIRKSTHRAITRLRKAARLQRRIR